MGKDRFLGEYLVRKNIVTEEDMLDALEYQKKKSPTFEKIALKLSLLNMKQIFHILTMRADSDLSFEEIALKKRFLTQEQIEKIREYVTKNKPLIGESLVALGKVSKEVIESELSKFKKEVEEFHQISKLLRHITLFKYLKQNVLESLAYITTMEEYIENDRVVSEGDEADAFYCVVGGTLRVTKNNFEGGNEIYLTSIEKNDVFGESCIFERGKRTANITSDSKVLLLRIDRKPFIDFLKRHPRSSLSILIMIIQRLMFKLEFANKELAFERKQFKSQDDVDSILNEFFD